MTILDKILAAKRAEVAERRQRVPDADLERRLGDAPPVRDFRAALDAPGEVRVLAEVKKASPSAGVIRADFDPVRIARAYADNGGSAVSVLTDEPFFQGRLDYLTAIRQAVPVPVLRKDFLIDRYQLLEARVAGADAVLLIAECLPGDTLKELLDQTHGLGMQALVELYDADNVGRVVASGAGLIGVNNRDLRTFVTRLEHTLDLAPRIPADRCLISESGIRDRADVLALQRGGVRAVLVGETLMRADDVGAKLRELLGR